MRSRHENKGFKPIKLFQLDDKDLGKKLSDEEWVRLLNDGFNDGTGPESHALHEIDDGCDMEKGFWHRKAHQVVFIQSSRRYYKLTLSEVEGGSGLGRLHSNPTEEDQEEEEDESDVVALVRKYHQLRFQQLATYEHTAPPSLQTPRSFSSLLTQLPPSVRDQRSFSLSTLNLLNSLLLFLLCFQGIFVGICLGALVIASSASSLSPSRLEMVSSSALAMRWFFLLASSLLLLASAVFETLYNRPSLVGELREEGKSMLKADLPSSSSNTNTFKPYGLFLSPSSTPTPLPSDKLLFEQVRFLMHLRCLCDGLVFLLSLLCSIPETFLVFKNGAGLYGASGSDDGTSSSAAGLSWMDEAKDDAFFVRLMRLWQGLALVRVLVSFVGWCFLVKVVAALKRVMGKKMREVDAILHIEKEGCENAGLDLL